MRLSALKALIVLSALSGCTLNIEDKRLSRDEVAAAFKQRDAILVGITKKIEEIEKAKEKAK